MFNPILKSAPHTIVRLTAVFLIFTSLIISSFAQTPPQPSSSSIPQAELKQAEKTVKTFCTFWKSLKVDSMYLLMSGATHKDVPKMNFANIYKVLPDNSGKLASFTVKEAIPNENGVVVKTELTFVKSKPPLAVNGVHNFHLIIENGKWKVLTIVPPIVPPDVSGSGGHPGE
jgi:hypothetical protein